MTARRKTARKPKALVVEVLRDGFTGRIYSQVIDDNVRPPHERESDEIQLVVIDRENGRQYDHDTVTRRAQAVASLLGLPYRENLVWPCIAVRGHRDCRCPTCVEQEKRKQRK